MTREKCKEILGAITHFANGGALWRHSVEFGWEIQREFAKGGEHYYDLENIVQDKHFESRKAFALGEEIEFKMDMGWHDTEAGDFDDTIEYRPKPKEVYEWQWVFGRGSSSFYLTDEHFTNYDKGWTKFEPSKRIRPCKN